ncbi:MAG: hypothetical protein LBC75_02190 [Fibromonadaceae bacterium]|jgi:hypothetical protein|nr:hypothetical protein [Fibromonadaceae bacterium]
MKKYSILFAAFLFSCTSEIESPDSILQRFSSSSEANPYQVLTNIDFATGGIGPWEISYGSLWDSPNKGKIKLVEHSTYYDVIFTPSLKEEHDWDLQLLQRHLNIKPGYSYNLAFGGNTTKENSKAPLVLVLLHCEEDGTCESGDYKKWEKSFSSSTYTEYEDVWNNCNINDPNTTFVISAGHSTVEFLLSWISLWAVPINCP